MKANTELKQSRPFSGKQQSMIPCYLYITIILLNSIAECDASFAGLLTTYSPSTTPKPPCWNPSLSKLSACRKPPSLVFGIEEDQKSNAETTTTRYERSFNLLSSDGGNSAVRCNTVESGDNSPIDIGIDIDIDSDDEEEELSRRSFFVTNAALLFAV